MRIAVYTGLRRGELLVLRWRFSGRSIDRELLQCDPWEPRGHVAVGHGQTRRGWMVTCEVRWSRAIGGTLIFSKQGPDIL